MSASRQYKVTVVIELLWCLVDRLWDLLLIVTSGGSMGGRRGERLLQKGKKVRIVHNLNYVKTGAGNLNLKLQKRELQGDFVRLRPLTPWTPLGASPKNIGFNARHNASRTLWFAPDCDIVVPSHRTDWVIKKFKFASRVCEEWNRLRDGIVSAGTVNVFKTRLDHHLRNVRGYL